MLASTRLRAILVDVRSPGANNVCTLLSALISRLMTTSSVHVVAFTYSPLGARGTRREVITRTYTDAKPLSPWWCNRESHSRVWGRRLVDEGRSRGGGEGEGEGGGKGARLRTRIKLSRVYILHTLFNFTTSRFNSDDGFSTITRPYFLPAPTLPMFFLPPSPFYSIVFSLSLSFVRSA